MPPKFKSKCSLRRELFTLARTAQIYWFIGHVSAIVFFFASLLFRFISKTKEKQFFKLSIILEMVSYGCVLKQLPSENLKSLQILKNESAQYFFFALVILLTSFKSDPWIMGLTSFIVYSFFHSITFFQASFLEYLPILLQAKANISQKISTIASNYNEQALYFASISEFSLLQNLFWDFFKMMFKIWGDPLYALLSLLKYVTLVAFLKLRYDNSRYTKTVIQVLDQRATTILSNPMMPPQIFQFYNLLFKAQVKQIVSRILVPNTMHTEKTQ